MTKLATQLDFWNARSKGFEKVNSPLVPDEKDIAFHKQYLKKGGKTLILGVTPSFCEIAKEIAASITAVDFSGGMINKLKQDGVTYICMDWQEYFDQTDELFDNILTDAGMACIAYPKGWKDMAISLNNHLKPNGIFSSRFFLSTQVSPKEHYDNPDTNRIVPGMANLDSNWMRKPQLDSYRDYDVPWAFPTEEVVLENFDNLLLIGKHVPDYEEGERFISFAWQKDN